jgi:tRNA threonylcarbamoyladenosine modification (KEOPS) complex Cgi121 subunit
MNKKSCDTARYDHLNTKLHIKNSLVCNLNTEQNGKQCSFCTRNCRKVEKKNWTCISTLQAVINRVNAGLEVKEER